MGCTEKILFFGGGGASMLCGVSISTKECVQGLFWGMNLVLHRPAPSKIAIYAVDELSSSICRFGIHVIFCRHVI